MIIRILLINGLRPAQIGTMVRSFPKFLSSLDFDMYSADNYSEEFRNIGRLARSFPKFPNTMSRQLIAPPGRYRVIADNHFFSFIFLSNSIISIIFAPKK